MSNDDPNAIDRTLGAAIRAARFSRGLTQQDLAEHLGITRATLASYETGRRKIAAETLIQIARLCNKPLGFFEPGSNRQSVQQAIAVEVAPMRAEQPALRALVQALELRPDVIPLVMEFLEAWLTEHERHAPREPA